MSHVDFTKEPQRIISLCTGMRGLERGLERAGVDLRVLCFLEIEAFIIENLVQQMEQGVLAPAPIWSNLKTFNAQPFCGMVDGIMGGYPCFTAGTLVLTIDGYKPIEEVKVGDKVLSHLGKWRNVTATMQKENAPLQRISSQGSSNIITTPEHPFWARTNSRKWRVDGTRGYDKIWNEPAWIEASKLTNHYTSQVLPSEKFTGDNPNVWWIIGRYLADGWMQKSPSHNGKGRVIICCAKTEADFLESKLRIAGFQPYKSEERTTTRFTITRKWFYDRIQSFGRYSHGKYLPGYAFELSKECSFALIDGYFSGDGSFEKNGGRRATTVSKRLALSMALLAQRAYGVVATVTKNKSRGTTVIEGRVVNERDNFVVQIPTKNRSAFVENNYGWKRVRKCEPCGFGKVYNIAVEEDESYMVENCIVHNCQPFSVAGKRDGAEDPRHLWPYIERMVGTIRPLWCFFENVPGHLSLGYREVRSDLERLGYAVEEGIFSAEEVGAPHQRKRLFILAIRKEFLDNSSGNGLESINKISTGRNSVEFTSEELENSTGERWRRRSDVGPHGGRTFQTEGSGALADPNDQREQQSEGDYQKGREWSGNGSEIMANSEIIGIQGDRSERKQITEISARKEISGRNRGGDRWPARPGEPQQDWEAPRVESLVGFTINGHNYREDLLRMAGNGVVEQTAELAFRTLVKKFCK